MVAVLRAEAVVAHHLTCFDMSEPARTRGANHDKVDAAAVDCLLEHAEHPGVPARAVRSGAGAGHVARTYTICDDRLRDDAYPMRARTTRIRVRGPYAN